MPKTDAQRKWDKKNLTVVTCRLSKAKKKEFADACAKFGVAMNSVLLKAVNETIEKSRK